ncbi:MULTISPECIES: 4'-phosphopantetheinyl transferase family protein [Proteus]|uniref:4'-phosphopantetheinyl transferase family protein n=1 Tax=Proteus TaxID=583 RepID=UPI00192A0E5B|nr:MULTISPECIES: 4'-phosphopantetheinyl transferase superfamily protein [Proteus]
MDKNLFKRNEVHIWIGNLANMLCWNKAKSRMHILNNEEISSLFSYHLIKQRHLFLLSRVMLRDILSFYLDIPPADIKLLRNQYGKPFIENNDITKKIQFNLSHSHDCVAIAISNTSLIGVDIEYCCHNRELNNIIEYCFSEKDKQYLSYFNETQKKYIFYKMWTLKEAYVKSIGCGLSNNYIKEIDFYLRRNRATSIEFIEKNATEKLSFMTRKIFNIYQISTVTQNNQEDFQLIHWL